MHTGNLVQVGEGLAELIVLHTVDIQVEPLIERVVQVSPDGVGAVFIQLLGVGDQVQRLAEDFDPDRQFGACCS
ncbi:hypothetical protein [Nocardia sp. CC201C]|uniref:hypothetical protein n=1 Tax=Nocardia sp. CC201C TaxID=3044575 RepID=UPI0024A8203C|nr:hypothetical protein [Nocardia sp. CC201C]